MVKGEAGYHDFRSGLFCFTAPNLFVEESSCVTENFGFLKTLCLGGEYHDSLKKAFCLTVPKIFLSEPFTVSLSLSVEKKYA